MSEQERQQFNARAFQKFKAAGTGNARNECEICGFVPYTKNKYREKQDHLAKFHFKERIDLVLPTSRPYLCPDADCSYLGKDKQDILRHYTGKHNILKMWVDSFIREQTGRDPEKARRPLWQTGQVVSQQQEGLTEAREVLTFREMEGRAIQDQRRIRAEDEEEEPSSVITISKVSRLSPPISPNISLLRVGGNQNQGKARLGSQDQIRTPLFVSRTKTVPSTTTVTQARSNTSPAMTHNTKLPKLVLVKCKFCLHGESLTFPSIALWKEHCLVAHSDLDLSTFGGKQLTCDTQDEKQKCLNCSMAFPSLPALRLHREVCPEAEVEVEDDIVDTPPFRGGSISLELVEPPKKKARRPPPPLIKIL